MRNSLKQVLAITILLTWVGTCHAVHPYHVSLAEVEWNPKSGNFEVALCVWPADLEQSLSDMTGRTIDLDEEPQVDKLVQEYISKRFSIRIKPSQKNSQQPTAIDSTTPSRQTMRWVGSDLQLKKAWLYFEIPGDKKAQTWELENRVFFERNEDQLNQVQFSAGNQKQSLALGIERQTMILTTEFTEPRRP